VSHLYFYHQAGCFSVPKESYTSALIIQKMLYNISITSDPLISFSPSPVFLMKRLAKHEAGTDYVSRFKPELTVQGIPQEGRTNLDSQSKVPEIAVTPLGSCRCTADEAAPGTVCQAAVTDSIGPSCWTQGSQLQVKEFVWSLQAPVRVNNLEIPHLPNTDVGCVIRDPSGRILHVFPKFEQSIHTPISTSETS
jgi:hypothetical protein